MNRKQFFIAVFSALVGAKRWRKWFAPEPAPFMFPASHALTLFNPSANIAALYMKPISFHPDCFSMVYPKIGRTLNIRKPVRYAAFIASDG